MFYRCLHCAKFEYMHCPSVSNNRLERSLLNDKSSCFTSTNTWSAALLIYNIILLVLLYSKLKVDKLVSGLLVTHMATYMATRFQFCYRCTLCCFFVLETNKWNEWQLYYYDYSLCLRQSVTLRKEHGSICVKPNPSHIHPNPGIQHIKSFMVEIAIQRTINCIVRILCIVRHE